MADIRAWNLDITSIVDWYDQSSSNGYTTISGPEVDLGSRIVTITVEDNGNGYLGVDDVLRFGDMEQPIVATYIDYLVIDGTEVQVATIFTESLRFTVPYRDGALSPAFAGMTGAGRYTNTTHGDVIGFPMANIPCFARGTMIDTDRGPVAIEMLQVGDLVRTKDNGVQPIRWKGATMVPAGVLSDAPHLRPIRIKAGALGAAMPAADLLVSPQHRILVGSRIAQRMFGAAEILVAAKQLLEIDGIEIAGDLPSVEYFHLLFDRHEVIFSNGAETESLYTGPEALKAVGAAALAEIYALFPQLESSDHVAVPARTFVPGRSARRLAQRHLRNNRALVG